MPFFDFLRRGDQRADGCRQRRGESVRGGRSRCASSVSVGKDDSPAVARCSEKSSGFLGVPGLGFFGGSKESQSASSDAPAAVDKREKARLDTLARENEQTPEPPKKPQPTQPIPFEHFSREWMNISGQDTFDGFRLEGAKQVNKYLQTCHSFCLGTQLRESGYSYQFGPTVAISPPPDPSQGENAQPPPPHFFAMAKLGTDGSLQGRPGLGLVFEGRLAVYAKSSEYESHLQQSLACWILDGMFSQVLTPRLQAGCEITYVGANGASMLAVGGRYNLDKQSVVSCQLSQQPDFKSPAGLTKLTHTCKVQYARKVTDRLSMASEFEYSHPETESALRVGWEYLFRQARVQGLIDSCGRISVFAQDYNGFGVSGLIDYWRGTYKFGFLMHVVPPLKLRRRSHKTNCSWPRVVSYAVTIYLILCSLAGRGAPSEASSPDFRSL